MWLPFVFARKKRGAGAKRDFSRMTPTPRCLLALGLATLRVGLDFRIRLPAATDVVLRVDFAVALATTRVVLRARRADQLAELLLHTLVGELQVPTAEQRVDHAAAAEQQPDGHQPAQEHAHGPLVEADPIVPGVQVVEPAAPLDGQTDHHDGHHGQVTIGVPALDHHIAHHREEARDEEDDAGGDRHGQCRPADAISGLRCFRLGLFGRDRRYQVPLTGPVHGRAGEPGAETGILARNPALQQRLHLAEHAVEGRRRGQDHERHAPPHEQEVHGKHVQRPDHDAVGRREEQDRPDIEQPHRDVDDEQRDERCHRPGPDVADQVHEDDGAQDVQRLTADQMLHQPVALGGGDAVVDEIDGPRQPFPDVVHVALGDQLDVLDVPTEVRDHHEHRVAVGRRRIGASGVSRHHRPVVLIELQLFVHRDRRQQAQRLGGLGQTLAVHQRQVPVLGGLVDELETAQLHDRSEDGQGPFDGAVTGPVGQQRVHDAGPFGRLVAGGLDRHDVPGDRPALGARSPVRVEREHHFRLAVRVARLVSLGALGTVGPVDEPTVRPADPGRTLGDLGRVEDGALGTAVELGEQGFAQGRGVDVGPVDPAVHALEQFRHGPAGEPGEPRVRPDDPGERQEHRLTDCLGHAGHERHRERENRLGVLHVLGGEPRVDDGLADLVVHLIGHDAVQATANRRLPVAKLVVGRHLKTPKA